MTLPTVHNPPAADFADKRFGRPTRPISSLVTVGVSVVEVLRNNPARLYTLIVNRSAADGAFDFSREFTAANGFLLPQSGGFVELSVESDGETVGHSLFGISSLGNLTWRVLELIAI